MQDMINHVWEIPSIEPRKTLRSQRPRLMQAAELEWLQDDSSDIADVEEYPVATQAKLPSKTSKTPRQPWASRQEQHYDRIFRETKDDKIISKPTRLRPAQVTLSEGEPFHDEVTAYQGRYVLGQP